MSRGTMPSEWAASSGRNLDGQAEQHLGLQRALGDAVL